MEHYLADELICIAYSLIFGVVIAVFYDLFRLLRLLFNTKAAAAFIEDMLFWLISAVLTSMFVFTFNSGVLRMYLFAAVAIGFVVWYLTLGRWLFGVFGRAAPRIRRVFGRVFSPVRRLWGRAVKSIRGFWRKTREEIYENRLKKKKKKKKTKKNSENPFHFHKKRNIIKSGKYSYVFYDAMRGNRNETMDRE